MKYLNYQTKDESGRIVAIKYFPTDQEAEEISSILLSLRKPESISFRGQIIKTKNIEILDEDNLRRDKEHYDLRDPEKKREVRMFEDIILDWFENQPIEKKTFESYLADKKVIQLTGEPRIGISGKERYDPQNQIILKSLEYADLSAKWFALNALRFMREMAERNEKDNVESLKTIKQEFPLASQVDMPDEINVSAMFSQ